MMEAEDETPTSSTTGQQQRLKKRKSTKSETTTKKIAKKATETFSREELNLRLDLHPLSHYVSDRDNLVDQLFTILSGDQLQKMIPATLQSYSLTEIRERVMLEAKKYKNEEILKIIHEAVPNVSKSRETDVNQEGHSEVGDEMVNDPPHQKRHHDTLELCPDQGEVDSLIGSESKESRLFSEAKEDSTIGNERQDDQDQTEEGGVADLSGVGTEWVSSLAKSQLEILELEMRARAIKSLMKAQGMPVPDDSEEEAEIAEVEEEESEQPEVEEISCSPLAELTEPDTLPVDDLEEKEERETEVESDSSSSKRESSASHYKNEDVTSRESAVKFSHDELPTEMMDEEDLVEPNVTLDDMEIPIEDQEERIIVEDDKPEEEIVEDNGQYRGNIEEEVEEVVSMMLLKVVSDEVVAREKRERRNRRQLRRKAKIVESDIEEGQIMDDSDSGDLSY